MAWTTEKQPFGVNHAPLLTGLALDGSGAVPVAVDPATGGLVVSATISPGSLPATLVNGQQTVTTSAVALPSGALTQGVVLEALSTNTVSIFVGATGVTTSTGYELQPGASIGIAVDNTNRIFVRCTSTSPVVSWIGS